MSATISLLEIEAREKAQMPPEWKAFHFESLPHDGKAFYFKIVGAIAPTITRGPRTGQRNWRKLDKTTERVVNIPFTEHDAWCIKWEESTGKCSHCTGTGRELQSWSVKDGCQYRPCPKCEGTGRAASRRVL